MHARAQELITALGLTPHREGGHFREIYRSSSSVETLDGRTARAALTTIYFVLTSGEISRWHRVRSDEVWHYLEGAPLELQVAQATFDRTETVIIGQYSQTSAPVRVVPAGWWQAARSTGDYTLVSCDVAPGFDYEDFVLLRDWPSDAELLKTKHPALAGFV